MAEFHVITREVWTRTFIVEAEDRDAAIKEVARRSLEKEEDDSGGVEFESVQQPSTWSVECGYCGADPRKHAEKCPNKENSPMPRTPELGGGRFA